MIDASSLTMKFVSEIIITSVIIINIIVKDKIN